MRFWVTRRNNAAVGSHLPAGGAFPSWGWGAASYDRLRRLAYVATGGALEAYLESRGPATAGVVPVSKDRMTLGRAAEADVSLSEDSMASRLHSCLERYPGGWVLRDLGSTNGTFVNGERLVGDRPLQSGDEIRIGATVFVFRVVESGSYAQATVRGETPPTITRREREVLVELCRPLADRSVAFGQPASVAEIAARLFIGQATVKFHLGNLFDKFGLLDSGPGRRLALANEALGRGAVTVTEVSLPRRGSGE